MGQNFDPETLIHIHLRLECIGLDQELKMTRIPGPDPDDLPRVYIAQFQKQSRAFYLRFYRDDLPGRLCAKLGQLAPEEALHQHHLVQAILEDHFHSPGYHYGKSYIFPDTIGPEKFPDSLQLTSSYSHLIQIYDPKIDLVNKRVFAIIRDGLIVSTCQSSRENDEAGEAWVRTLPEYRGRGFARQVTAAWAYDLFSRSKTPFYSHKMANTASEAVALGMGLIQYITDAAYE
jgi:hypothetical protein